MLPGRHRWDIDVVSGLSGRALARFRLAALSLAGHTDPERFVAEFSGTDRTVADYLLTEMLERQPVRSRICSCAPRCSTASAASWPTC